MDYVGSSSTGGHVSNENGGNATWENNLSHYQGMIFYATSHEFGMSSQTLENVLNLDDERFYSLLEIVNKPLWEGCVHS